MTGFSPVDAWAFKALMTGSRLNGHIAVVSDPWRPLATMMESLPANERLLAWQGALTLRTDAGDIRNAVMAADPTAPMPTNSTTRKFATLADVRRQQSAVRWKWDGWIPSSSIVGVAAFEGVGKTRLLQDMSRRIWFGLPWPDGQPATFPPGTPTLWLCSDGQQDELADTAAEFGLPDEAIVFPAPDSEPYSNTSLDSEETEEWIDDAMGAVRPGLMVIDTLTFATSRDLCEQRSVAILKGPLIKLAQKHQTSIMLSLHLSQQGQALGRRIKGITRSLIHLESPDPDRSERLRLWVEKTYAQKPDALGVTMGPNGNTYDYDPPARVDPSKGGRPPEKLDEAIAFLKAKLKAQDEQGRELIDQWEAHGKNKATLFNARKKLVADGRLVVDDTKKPQIWHLVPINPASEVKN